MHTETPKKHPSLTAKGNHFCRLCINIAIHDRTNSCEEHIVHAVGVNTFNFHRCSVITTREDSINVKVNHCANLIDSLFVDVGTSDGIISSNENKGLRRDLPIQALAL
jgi:hypothetical protein